ncbi:acid phosphatase [Planosporangium thailandense]|uniref:Acid phosphatase n=1 Tax=Planosporangium thailandense TaxID=765197 RepID=A0ABX0Y364_9ACTN|nr:alkaline phosphatase family protein [Planosporangium thailandense]NJC72010.1 acid phosphatase [Planosporangium thailandense]
MRISTVAVSLAMSLASALVGAAAPAPAAVAAAALPAYDHILVVVEENHSYSEVVGNSSAPYITSLASGGANMTQSFAVTHPSEPNYLALFSGSTQGLTDDSCPHTYSAENLGHQLINSGQTFKGYSESMPSDGYTGCTSGQYARKHNPWVDFSNVPSSSNLRFADFPTDYTTLPKISFVVPNLCDDMHDCGVSTGDTWLKNNLGAYASWATTHNSLLVVTFDEDDRSASNRIPTVFYGAHVATGSYPEHITHYTVLRTLESLTGLGCVANSCSVSPISDIWN